MSVFKYVNKSNSPLTVGAHVFTSSGCLHYVDVHYQSTGIGTKQKTLISTSNKGIYDIPLPQVWLFVF